MLVVISIPGTDVPVQYSTYVWHFTLFTDDTSVDLTPLNHIILTFRLTSWLLLTQRLSSLTPSTLPPSSHSSRSRALLLPTYQQQVRMRDGNLCSYACEVLWHARNMLLLLVEFFVQSYMRPSTPIYLSGRNLIMRSMTPSAVCRRYIIFPSQCTLSSFPSASNPRVAAASSPAASTPIAAICGRRFLLLSGGLFLNGGAARCRGILLLNWAFVHKQRLWRHMGGADGSLPFFS